MPLMSLSIEQQKRLYSELYDHIVKIHTGEFKKELTKFTEDYRKKRTKGIVLLDYTNIKDMISATKDKSFFYEWVNKDDALKIGHSGISEALSTMNPSLDCVFVCSLSLSLKHLYINCVKIQYINK